MSSWPATSLSARQSAQVTAWITCPPGKRFWPSPRNGGLTAAWRPPTCSPPHSRTARTSPPARGRAPGCRPPPRPDTPMSMFDYDARPATAQVVLVGASSSRAAYEIRDFLARNGRPFEWVDAGQPDAVQAALGVAGVPTSSLPVCVLPDGSQLASATVQSVATGLGMLAAPSRSDYDLLIVGAGPAGLGAAVNAASEIG